MNDNTRRRTFLMATFSQEAAKPSNKRYEVEAFTATSVNERFQPIVKVKYLQHDDSEWETMEHVRSELGDAAFEELMQPFVTKHQPDDDD